MGPQNRWFRIATGIFHNREHYQPPAIHLKIPIYINIQPPRAVIVLA